MRNKVFLMVSYFLQDKKLKKCLQAKGGHFSA
jgi:hypothetical protein